MRAFRLAAVIGATSLAGASLLHAGWQGFAAALVGALGTVLYLGATWLVVRLAGSAVSDVRTSPRQTLVAFAALALKLPLIYLGWMASQRLGPFGPPWFLAGLGLVYSLTIWRAALAVRD
jgi:hypothetical protein